MHVLEWRGLSETGVVGFTSDNAIHEVVEEAHAKEICAGAARLADKLGRPRRVVYG